ncbi:MAG: hypothetical protein INF12_14735 [Methylobacterium sp.]|nr:hypothetical protein [Methylobacterium sp.]
MTDWKPVSQARFDGRQVLIAGVGGAGPFQAVMMLGKDGKLYQFDPLGDGFIHEVDLAGLMFRELDPYPNEFAKRAIKIKHTSNQRYVA